MDLVRIECCVPNLRTSNWTGYGWTAVDDDTYDGAEDSRSPIGTGNTEAEAVADLMEQIETE